MLCQLIVSPLIRLWDARVLCTVTSDTYLSVVLANPLPSIWQCSQLRAGRQSYGGLGLRESKQSAASTEILHQYDVFKNSTPMFTLSRVSSVWDKVPITLHGTVAGWPGGCAMSDISLITCELHSLMNGKPHFVPCQVDWIPSSAF